MALRIDKARYRYRQSCSNSSHPTTPFIDRSNLQRHLSRRRRTTTMTTIIMTMKKIMKMMVIVCLLFVLSSIYDDCVSGFKRCNGHRMSRFVCFSFVRSFVTNQSIDSQYHPIVSTSITHYDATRCGKRSGQHDRSTRVVDGVHEHQRYRSTNATGHRIDHGDADAFKVRIGCGEIHR